MKPVFTILISFMGLCSTAQSLKVIDKESVTPIEFVSIVSQNPPISTSTNINGEADITGFKESKEIEFRIIGYITQIYSYKELEEMGFKVELQQSSFSIDQLVISASKWNQTAREVPNKITAITPIDIAFQNPQTAADLIGTSGEVFIQKSQQGGGSPMIRGFATNRLLIVIDGVRMNTAIFRSGNLQNIISLDPFAIEQTEVLFGPGSVIYGSDAIGGVMSFYTLSPKLSYQDKSIVSGSISSRYSSANNEKTGHIDINSGWEKWAIVSSISYNNYGNVRMGSNGPKEYLRKEYVERIGNTDVVTKNSNDQLQRPTGYSQINLLQKVLYKPNTKWDLSYNILYSTTTDYDRYDRLIIYKNGLPKSAEWYYGPQKWLMNSIILNSHKSNRLYDQVSFHAAHQLFEESRVDRNFNNTNRKHRFEKVNAISTNFDFKKAIGLKNKLFYGIEAIYNDVNSTGKDEDISTGNKVDGPSRYPQSEWTSYAAYLTYQRKLTDKTMLHLGSRYNQYILNAKFHNTFYPFPFTKANINNGALTGSIGLTYNPNSKWSINADLSTGFRSPNVDDMGKIFDSEPGSVVVPNPNLKVEYAYNAEIGVTKVFGDFLEIDVAAFYTILDDALVKRNSTLNGQDSIMYDGVLSQVQSIQNAAFARVWGIQADFELKLPAGFGISSRYNYQKGEEELDNGEKSPLRHAAPWFGISRLTYSDKKIRLDLYAAYSGEVSYKNLADEERGKPYIYAIDSNGKPYSPSWYTLNLKTQYKINKTFTISGDIENITDQRYRPYSSGMVAPGINFVMGIKAIF